MPRFITLFAALFLVLLSSCDKSHKHYKLDPVFRQYFAFPNGSQWKYVSYTDTGDVETVVAEGFVEGKMFWDALDQEFIQVDLRSDKDSLYKFRAIADDLNASRAVMIVKDSFFKKTMEWYSSFGVLSGVQGSGDSFTLHPSYVVKGKSYSNVVELKPAKPVHYKKLFIAPTIGVVRKELLSGKIYLLKSYSLQ